MIVARETRLLLLVLVLAAIIVQASVGWIPAVIILLFAAIMAFVFRDPGYQVPSSPLAVVCPANGEIVSIETVRDPWLERDALRCRTRMSLTDVHRLRSPVEGKVKNQWAEQEDTPGVSRRYTYWIQTDEGDDVIFSVATGGFPSITRIDLRCGERIGQGQQCGYLYFSGLIDVLLPVYTRMALKPGERVHSGSSIIGQFIHSNGIAAAGK